MNDNPAEDELSLTELDAISGGGAKRDKAVQVMQAHEAGQIQLSTWEKVSVLAAYLTGVMAGPDGQGDYRVGGDGNNPFG